MTICERMFTIMEKKNKKAADLCRLLNISTAQTTSWKKRNTDPPAKYLAKICKFLEISLYELLDEENENEIENIYKKLSSEDKQIVDIIFNKYKKEEKSSNSMIG